MAGVDTVVTTGTMCSIPHLERIGATLMTLGAQDFDLLRRDRRMQIEEVWMALGDPIPENAKRCCILSSGLNLCSTKCEGGERWLAQGRSSAPYPPTASATEESQKSRLTHQSSCEVSSWLRWLLFSRRRDTWFRLSSLVRQRLQAQAFCHSFQVFGGQLEVHQDCFSIKFLR